MELSEEQQQTGIEEPVAEAADEVAAAAAPGEESAEAGDGVQAEADAEGGEPAPEAEAFLDASELFGEQEARPNEAASDEASLRALIEAVIYITEEPLTLDQLATALERPKEAIAAVLERLTADYQAADRGLTIRELAGGYKMGTKPEHHEAIRQFVKKLKPPLKLSLAALETLAVIAYKQPITAPEIMDVRGVQGAGVIKTLLDRKLIAPAGRKQVVGKPILYKTTKDFLLQFGLRDLAELPTLKEFEEIGRMALTEEAEVPADAAADAAGEPPETEPAAAGAEEEPPQPDA